MQVFSCLVWLTTGSKGDGIRTTQVPKNMISAAEVIILRKLHGLDQVVDLTLIGDEKRSLRKERADLERIYGKKLVTSMWGDPELEEDRFPVKLSNFKPKATAKADPVADMAA